jgi:protein-S-isoprenylcysteine O-methyltransferase Ste14
MLMLFRQLLAVAVLPFTVAVMVPVWIARRNQVSVAIQADLVTAAFAMTGAVAVVIGLALFTSSLYVFWTRGRGTLAPWDPPLSFVADGPYRYVRNPMISGVIFILLGESLILRSWAHAEWTTAFFVLNVIYIPLIEEPMLAARFGGSYATYKRNVGRFVPRIRPWRPGESHANGNQRSHHGPHR